MISIGTLFCNLHRDANGLHLRLIHSHALAFARARAACSMQMSTYNNKLASYINNTSMLHNALSDMTASKNKVEEELLHLRECSAAQQVAHKEAQQLLDVASTSNQSLREHMRRLQEQQQMADDEAEEARMLLEQTRLSVAQVMTRTRRMVAARLASDRRKGCVRTYCVQNRIFLQATVRLLLALGLTVRYSLVAPAYRSPLFSWFCRLPLKRHGLAGACIVIFHDGCLPTIGHADASRQANDMQGDLRQTKRVCKRLGGWGSIRRETGSQGRKRACKWMGWGGISRSKAVSQDSL